MQAICIAQSQLTSLFLGGFFLHKLSGFAHHSSVLYDHIITYREMPISNNATADLYKLF